MRFCVNRRFHRNKFVDYAYNPFPHPVSIHILLIEKLGGPQCLDDHGVLPMLLEQLAYGAVDVGVGDGGYQHVFIIGANGKRWVNYLQMVKDQIGEIIAGC